MKRIMYIACLFCVMGNAGKLHAQMIPKYQYTAYNGDTNNVLSVYFNNSPAILLQWIYRPSQLPGLPAGPLHSVYLRVGRKLSVTLYNPTVYDSVRIQLGLTMDTSFKDTMVNGYPGHVIMEGLTQVFFQQSYSIYGADSVGTWFRFPISGEFNYDPNQNLVFEISRGAQAITQSRGINLMTSQMCIHCCFGAFPPDNYVLMSNPIDVLADIGFDDAPTVVGGLVNLKGFYAYPNPSQGLFTVGFEPWSGHASTVQVSVTDMAGRQVWQHSYQGVQASLFTANVDLRGRPKGVYLLRVQADAAQALQRVVVE